MDGRTGRVRLLELEGEHGFQDQTGEGSRRRRGGRRRRGADCGTVRAERRDADGQSGGRRGPCAAGPRVHHRAGEPFGEKRDRRPQHAVHHVAGAAVRRGRELLRRDAPERAELHRDDQRVELVHQQRQPGEPVRPHQRGRHAGGGPHQLGRLHGGAAAQSARRLLAVQRPAAVRVQAQPVRAVHRRPRQPGAGGAHQAVHRAGGRPEQPSRAPVRVHHAGPVQRHARRGDRRDRRASGDPLPVQQHQRRPERHQAQAERRRLRSRAR